MNETLVELRFPKTSSRLSRCIDYTAAIVLPHVALAVSWAVQGGNIKYIPYSFFTLAVLLSAWIGGLAPGLITTGISALYMHAWLSRYAHLTGQPQAAFWAFITFIFVFILISLIISNLQKKHSALQKSEEALRQDIILRKQQEQALIRSEKLAATGRLAATLAHEINNPLDAVGNMLHMIGQGGTDDQIRQYASLASEELAKVTQITSRMLSFQREAHKPIPVCIQEVLENTVALWNKKSEAAGIQIKLQVEDDCEIVALPGELRQVFANLVGNAIEAMGTNVNHGRIRIHAATSRDWRRGCPGLRVIVADNGPGIPDEIRGKIFDPFFTTKGESGTGLGLWITSDIVRKYDGTMRLRSTTRAGRSGTSFSIFFPLASKEDAASAVRAR